MKVVKRNLVQSSRVATIINIPRAQRNIWTIGRLVCGKNRFER